MAGAGMMPLAIRENITILKMGNSLNTSLITRTRAGCSVNGGHASLFDR